MKAATTPSARAALLQPAQASRTARASGARMNAQPSAAIGSIRSDIRGGRYPIRGGLIQLIIERRRLPTSSIG